MENVHHPLQVLVLTNGSAHYCHGRLCSTAEEDPFRPTLDLQESHLQETEFVAAKSAPNRDQNRCMLAILTGECHFVFLLQSPTAELERQHLPWGLAGTNGDGTITLEKRQKHGASNSLMNISA